MRTRYRADQIGSPLRPAELLRARSVFPGNPLTRDELRRKLELVARVPRQVRGD